MKSNLTIKRLEELAIGDRFATKAEYSQRIVRTIIDKTAKDIKTQTDNGAIKYIRRSEEVVFIRSA